MRILAPVAILLLVSVLPLAYATTYHSITCDGNMDDWGEDEAMGTMNSATLYVTFDFYNLYLGFSRGSVDNDMFVAIDVRNGGTNESLNWNGIHELPFQADFYVGIENESYAYLFAYNGNWSEIASISSLGGYVRNWNTNIEIRIPLRVLGYPSRVNLLAYGQWENAINVWAVWPLTNPWGMGPQKFTNYISLPLESGIRPADYMYGVKFPKPKFKIDGYLTDWSGDSNLTVIEDSSEDSAGDLKNVVENEIYFLYVTWDNSYLYLGYEYRTGVWGDSVYDNGTMLFIDASSPLSPGTDTLRNMNVWPRRIDFGNFRLQYFYGKWDGMRGNLYRVVSENTSMDISSDFIVATTGGDGVRGDVEMAIPWRVIYGDDYLSVMYNLTGLKISLAVVGHDNETALDTVPDVGDVTKDTNFTDEVRIDYFLNTGKIFSPPSLAITDVSYMFNSSGLLLSWKTNHRANCTVDANVSGNVSRYNLRGENFTLFLDGVGDGDEFNITIVAEDCYGNRVSKTVSYAPEKGEEEVNETLEGGEINPIYLSAAASLGIIAVGEAIIWWKWRRKT